MHCSRCRKELKKIKGNQVKPYCTECFKTVWGNDIKAYAEWFILSKDDVS